MGLIRDVNRRTLLVSARLPEATSGVSLEASLLLMRLIGMAANAQNAGRSADIPLSPQNYTAFANTPSESKALPVRLAELKLRGLIKQVTPGVFRIAPTLWKVDVEDPSDWDWRAPGRG